MSWGKAMGGPLNPEEEKGGGGRANDSKRNEGRRRRPELGWGRHHCPSRVQLSGLSLDFLPQNLLYRFLVFQGISEMTFEHLRADTPYAELPLASEL